MSWIVGRDYTGLGGASAGELQTLAGNVAVIGASDTAQNGRLNALESSQATQDGQLGTLNTQNATQDANIAATTLVANNAAAVNTTQNGRLNSLEATANQLVLSGATSGQVLAWSTATSKWQPATVSSGASALSGLSDTAIASLADNQLLAYNASTGRWTNRLGRVAELGDVALNTVSLIDNQVLTWSTAFSRWTNLSVPRSTTQLVDVALTPPTNGQVLVYNSTTARYTPTTMSTTSTISGASDFSGTPAAGQVIAWNAGTSRWNPIAAPSGSISGATDYLVSGTLAGADVMVWDSANSRWRNSKRLTAAEQTISTLTPPTASATLSASQTILAAYSNTIPQNTGTNATVLASDSAFPFAYIDRSSDYVLVPANVTMSYGFPNPNPPTNMYLTDLNQFQYVGGAGGGSGGARANYDLAASTVLASTGTFTLNLSSGITFAQYQVYGSNSAGAMSDTLITGLPTSTYTLLYDWGSSLGLGGPTNSTVNTVSTGPFRYITFVMLSGGGWASNNNLHFIVRAAAGGVSAQSLLAGDITLTRAAGSGLPVITNTAGTNEAFVVNTQRLGLWLLWRDLLSTVTASQTVRYGGWRLEPGADLRELRFQCDGYRASDNTTPVAVNQGFTLRMSLQGGKNYLIVRPSGTTGMCIALNLDSTASTDAAVAFMPNTSSSTNSNVVAALRQDGNLFLAGTVTASQSGLLGALNPYA